MKAMVKLATALMGATLLAGCAGIRDHRGAMLDDELIAAVQVGVDNKQSVQQTLGRPPFAGPCSDNDWYSVSRDTSTFAFRNPRVTKQTVVRIRFDAKGNVIGIQKSGREQIANINPSNDKTPPVGRERSLVDDSFGNIGAVNSPLPTDQ